VGKKKPDFVGRRSLSRVDMLKDDCKHLVGLLTEDPNLVLEESAQIVDDPTHSIPMPMIGHVTSSYWSTTLGRLIALGVVAGGKNRLGETIYIPMLAITHKAKIYNMVFYDPAGQG
jgi:sarcosine oxidase, subunit alpha